MINNLSLFLLSGGWHHCTTSWNSKSSSRDHCYKLYIPVSGEATLLIGGKTCLLQPGNIYFINGFRLVEQFCDNCMDIYWLHFIPESLLLNYFLNINLDFYSWKLDDMKLRETDYYMLPSLFENPYSEENIPSLNASFGGTCSITAIILLLIADLAEKQYIIFNEEAYQVYLRLKPAIDFLENNYNKPITLKDIAGQIYLNPIYFHRLFKSYFKITPLEYLLAKRLNMACRYLNEKDLSIREISDSLGFCNQFYFSEIFKKRFGASPSKYRKHKNIP